ncbi:TPA: hypothetical protein I0I28_RS12585, partial [Enterococcus faecium]
TSFFVWIFSFTQNILYSLYIRSFLSFNNKRQQNYFYYNFKQMPLFTYRYFARFTKKDQSPQ